MSGKVSAAELARLLRAHAKDGLAAGREGKPSTANPWKPETFGGQAWAAGWRVGATFGKRAAKDEA
jgi:ribosome modulation factor